MNMVPHKPHIFWNASNWLLYVATFWKAIIINARKRKARNKIRHMLRGLNLLVLVPIYLIVGALAAFPLSILFGFIVLMIYGGVLEIVVFLRDKSQPSESAWIGSGEILLVVFVLCWLFVLFTMPSWLSNDRKWVIDRRLSRVTNRHSSSTNQIRRNAFAKAWLESKRRRISERDTKERRERLKAQRRARMESGGPTRSGESRQATNPARNSGIAIRVAQDADDFERVCAEYLRRIGHQNVVKTPKGPDGGVDVLSDRAVGQAKFHPSQKVSAEPIRALFGSMKQRGKSEAYFFHFGPGYTPDAVATAKSLGVALLWFSAQSLTFDVVA